MIKFLLCQTRIESAQKEKEKRRFVSIKIGTKFRYSSDSQFPHRGLKNGFVVMTFF